MAESSSTPVFTAAWEAVRANPHSVQAYGLALNAWLTQLPGASIDDAINHIANILRSVNLTGLPPGPGFRCQRILLSATPAILSEAAFDRVIAAMDPDDEASEQEENSQSEAEDANDDPDGDFTPGGGSTNSKPKKTKGSRAGKKQAAQESTGTELVKAAGQSVSAEITNEEKARIALADVIRAEVKPAFQDWETAQLIEGDTSTTLQRLVTIAVAQLSRKVSQHSVWELVKVAVALFTPQGVPYVKDWLSVVRNDPSMYDPAKNSRQVIGLPNSVAAELRRHHLNHDDVRDFLHQNTVAEASSALHIHADVTHAYAIARAARYFDLVLQCYRKDASPEQVVIRDNWRQLAIDAAQHVWKEPRQHHSAEHDIYIVFFWQHVEQMRMKHQRADISSAAFREWHTTFSQAIKRGRNFGHVMNYFGPGALPFVLSIGDWRSLLGRITPRNFQLFLKSMAEWDVRLVAIFTSMERNIMQPLREGRPFEAPLFAFEDTSRQYTTLAASRSLLLMNSAWSQSDNTDAAADTSDLVDSNEQ